jgi:protein TonB
MKSTGGVNVLPTVGKTADNNSYETFKVEKQAEMVESQANIQALTFLQNSSVAGMISAMFVVDTTGRADMNTFKVVSSAKPDLIPALKAGLPQIQYNSAEISGKKVRQLVTQAFLFSMK